MIQVSVRYEGPLARAASAAPKSSLTVHLERGHGRAPKRIVEVVAIVECTTDTIVGARVSEFTAPRAVVGGTLMRTGDPPAPKVWGLI